MNVAKVRAKIGWIYWIIWLKRSRSLISSDEKLLSKVGGRARIIAICLKDAKGRVKSTKILEISRGEKTSSIFYWLVYKDCFLYKFDVMLEWIINADISCDFSTSISSREWN